MKTLLIVIFFLRLSLNSHTRYPMNHYSSKHEEIEIVEIVEQFSVEIDENDLVAGSLSSEGNWVSDLGKENKFRIPNGVVVKAGEFGIEKKLVDFINFGEYSGVK
jgi:hypothetical protein